MIIPFNSWDGFNLNQYPFTVIGIDSIEIFIRFHLFIKYQYWKDIE